ncbi:Holliday junction branch migration protein RuvA [Desulfofalx alkaliphila]|uniref:Holliday junction branch migration protein RuvA n=1 Tax=Desulfofalx alkaliphila TaxID=105483 RepID=UPI0004E1418C|nr:Holliday junction branch migration protein RuvA [Desulfofalx alkaliphila]
MIAFLRGKLAAETIGSVVLDVNGVGYRLLVPNSTSALMPKIGEEVFLYTHLVVRENNMQLYGFSTEDELSTFLALLNVTGVGPKGALSVLSVYRPGEFKSIIDREDIKAIIKVPGVGKKTAQRLILELKDKLADIKPVEQNSQSPGNSLGSLRVDAEFALLALGYKQSEAQEAVLWAAEYQPAPEDTAGLVKLALKYLMTNSGDKR